jgi:hypothetical protein
MSRESDEERIRRSVEHRRRDPDDDPNDTGEHRPLDLTRGFPPPPQLCPFCAERKALRVTYGFPSWAAERAIAAGQIIHRGCMLPIDDRAVDWACQACGYEWADR